MPTRAANDTEKIELERQRFKAQLATAIEEEDDPLAVYDQFVQWTITNYGDNDPDSGLRELLKQATGEFKEDPLYKTDLRYLKLWSLYAGLFDRPEAIAIYGYLLGNGIGTSYSMLYEGYASLLEADGRWNDAKVIYRKGIKQQARPLERLKNRYREFQSRAPSTSSDIHNSALGSTKTSSSADGLRRNALKNQRSQAPSTSTSSSSFIPTTTQPSKLISHNSTVHSRYVHMLAPPDPGKRPEKLRFDLSLLFTEDSVEYSIQEARARKMGLLGKKWGPPPAPTISMPVDFNDSGQKSNYMAFGRRKSLMGGAEPTVTINTKEALADVFGMYNSPEKTRMLGVPGSKHAPLKKVAPMTPATLPRPVLSQENENSFQNAKTPTPAFRPFVDENLQLSRAPPGPVKFTPFVDTDSNKQPFTTPRAVLSLKDSTGPTPNPRSLENAPPHNHISVSKLKPVTDDPISENIFSSKAFNSSQSKPLAPYRDVFTEDLGKPQSKPLPTHERAKSYHDVSLSEEIARGVAFTPHVDENVKTPFKVFSRPPGQSENAFTPKTPAFTPFIDPKPAFTPFRDTHVAFTPLAEKNISEVFEQQPDEFLEADDVAEDEDVYYDDEDDDDDDDLNQRQVGDEYDDEDTPTGTNYGQESYVEHESYQDVPLGGRFGQFNVMTPITERTFEFTTSTRGGSTPSERLRNISEHEVDENDYVPQQRDERGAIITAKLLAAELRDDEKDEYDESQPLEPFRLSADPMARAESPRIASVEERTGTLSLSDTLAMKSKFKPENPCNPFDPAVMMTLLSFLPTDPHYYDRRDRISNTLDGLQRFAKKARKTSGNGGTAVLDVLSSYSLELDGHRFSVTEKLGEGGFGAVFKAHDLGEGQDDSDEELDDDEGLSMVALKVVKPRNIWEYHVLRRLHLVLPASLRRSVILPHALYAFQDESFLVLTLCTQGTLLDIVNSAVAAGVSQQGACLDELLVFFFTIELLRLLEATHCAGFIHGDLKIDNCLLRLEDVPGGASAWSSIYQPSGEEGWNYKGLKVIDFGRTIDTRLFPASQQYIAEWPTDDRDCFEARENRPWTYQTDYFGLAGIIYCMLFGKYIQGSSVAATTVDGNPRYKISTPLKRYWQTDLWNKLFDVLLNPSLVRPDGHLPLSEELGVLRVEMEGWLRANCNRTSNTLKGLLKKVEVSCFVR